VLPENISKVWIEAGDFLGVPPVATYAATVLFNFKDENLGKLKEPEDFEIEFTFTGTEDEKWFYAVSAAIDTQSYRIISCADRIFEEGKGADFNEIGRVISESIEEMTRILNKMYEKCRPSVFYGQVRKYLTGWLNDPQLPEGLTYELGPDQSIEMKLAGGSAAQNPTIQLLDILLGVKHEADTEDLMIPGYNGCPRMNYLGAMRTYMPREHEEYLNNLEKRATSFIKEFKGENSYNFCIKSLANFRSEHIKMVARYIICQIKTSKPLGTGGSNPIEFLKKCRDETEFYLLNNK
jgi:indoleamine 2,3-dioxygenase